MGSFWELKIRRNRYGAPYCFLLSWCHRIISCSHCVRKSTMASGYTCITCLRALGSRNSFSLSVSAKLGLKSRNRWTLTFEQKSTVRTSKRTLQSTALPSRYFSAAARQSNAQQATGKGTLTDDSSPANPLTKGDLLKDAPPKVRLATELRKRFKSTTETYVAYGSTEGLFKTCGAQAEYKIVRDKEGMAPKTATGEEIGESDSWWYKGMAAYLLCYTVPKTDIL